MSLLFLLACHGQPGEWVDTRVDHAPGTGETGAPSRGPQLCASGSLVYVAWADTRRGESRVYLNRSLDGGTTWEPVDWLVSHDTPDGNVAEAPALGCDGGTVAVLFQDDRAGPSGNPGIYAQVSTDAGATWPDTSLPLTPDAHGDWRSIEPRVVVKGNAVAAVWVDGRNGGYDIYYSGSVDSGATWSEDVRLDTDPAGSAWSADPALGVSDSGAVTVAWVDRRAGQNDIHANHSDAFGAAGTWWDEDQRLDTLDAPGASESFAPSIAVGDDVVVAWHDRYAGEARILAASVDGDAFTAPAAVGEISGESLFVRLAADGARVHATWRNNPDGVWDIVYAASTDAGATWTEPTRMDGGGEDSHSGDPVIAAGNGSVAIAWPDLRNSSVEEPREDVYITASADGGTTWNLQARVDDPEAGAARSVFPAIGLDDSGGALVAWEEWREGNPDIYFRAMEVR